MCVCVCVCVLCVVCVCVCVCVRPGKLFGEARDGIFLTASHLVLTLLEKLLSCAHMQHMRNHFNSYKPGRRPFCGT